VSANSPIDRVIGVGWGLSPYASACNLLTASKNCNMYLILVKMSLGNSWESQLLIC